jgi:hypothetical protein
MRSARVRASRRAARGSPVPRTVSSLPARQVLWQENNLGFDLYDQDRLPGCQRIDRHVPTGGSRRANSCRPTCSPNQGVPSIGRVGKFSAGTGDSVSPSLPLPGISPPPLETSRKGPSRGV